MNCWIVTSLVQPAFTNTFISLNQHKNLTTNWRQPRPAPHTHTQNSFNFYLRNTGLVIGFGLVPHPLPKSILKVFVKLVLLRKQSFNFAVVFPLKLFQGRPFCLSFHLSECLSIRFAWFCAHFCTGAVANPVCLSVSNALAPKGLCTLYSPSKIMNLFHRSWNAINLSCQV